MRANPTPAPTGTQGENHAMAIELPELPYPKDALAPHISAETIDFHYGAHHATYVKNLNNLVRDTEFAKASLEDIICKAQGGIFNNAAQVWNHTFYWHSMKPGGGGAPTGAIAKKIDSDLGGYNAFIEAFKNAAVTQFGSGWAWLVLNNGKLEITKTGNADTPIAHGIKPLLTVDVWEHAYYLDYQNRRPDYLDTFLKHLVNWDFANANLG